MLYVIRLDQTLDLDDIIKKNPPTSEEPQIAEDADEEVDYYIVPLNWFDEEEENE